MCLSERKKMVLKAFVVDSFQMCVCVQSCRRCGKKLLSRYTGSGFGENFLQNDKLHIEKKKDHPLYLLPCREG